ncbi:nonsense-mediated decay protein 4 [Diutina catenulata]
MDAPVVDELFARPPQESTTGASPSHPRRAVRLILDHSAFVRGIGNIKRWFNREYVAANFGASSVGDEPGPDHVSVDLIMYMPSYTFHEFDYVKKGTSMQATNAREAIRFIDYMFESDESPDNSWICYHLAIEGPGESGPSWPQCMRYKIHSPKVGEFPNYKTRFSSNSVVPAGSSDAIQYENSPSYASAQANHDQPADMPVRLRYLIRSCLHKRYGGGRTSEFAKDTSPSEYKLVTEDPITKIWAQSFGIDCLNVNEAELLVFNNYDNTGFANYNPHTSLDDAFDRGVLHNTIDTTRYEYTSSKRYGHGKKGRKMRTHKDDARAHKFEDGPEDNLRLDVLSLKDTDQDAKSEPGMKEGVHDNSVETAAGVSKLSNSQRRQRKPRRTKQSVKPPTVEGTTEWGEEIKRERFDMINYAPRGRGDLWTP